MKFIEFVVKHSQITFLFFVSIMVLGALVLLNIPRSEDPEISSPEFTIIVVYPGASPKDIEQTIIDPIEKKISSLENVRKLLSYSGDNFAMINVAYNFSVNIDDKYQEVIREVNSIRDELPDEISSIEVKKFSPSDVNIIQTALVSENASFEALKKHSERLKDNLEKLPQLKNVEIFGLPKKSIRVELSIDKMSKMNIPLDAVIGSIQSESVNIPGGGVNEGSKSFNILTSGNYKTIEEIQNTIVHSFNQKNIALKDIASVFFDFEAPKHITRLNSYRSVLVVAALKPGENITKSVDYYQPVLEDFKKELPANIDFIVNFEQANNVNDRLSGLGIDFLIAIALVSITLLPLGYRAAVIVMISIPTSLSIGLILMNFIGYNLNQLSIVGFVVALGLLVDDSIVVVENIERWLLEGHSRYEAVIKATKQILYAVIGCTATLIVAFLPLVLLPGDSGNFIRSLPMGVITTIFASMVVSLTLIPFISFRILKEHSGSSEGNKIMQFVKKGISASYSRLLEIALHKPVVTIVIALLIFSGSLLLIPVIGFSLFPASEKPQFLIDITAPIQSNIHSTDSISKDIENELRKIPEIKYYTANVGHGNPGIYYNVIPEREREDYAQVFVQLKDNTNPKVKLRIINELRSKWSPYLGAKIEVKDFEQGPPISAPVEIFLTGSNLDTLRRLASEVEEILVNTEGTIYVNNPLSNLKSDIRVNINKDKASMLGVPSINIDKAVRLAVTGLETGKLFDANGDSYDIIVTKQKENTESLEAFDNLFINNLQGTPVPLNQIASLDFESSPVRIDHRDKERSVNVSSFVKKGYLNDNVNNEILKTLKEKQFPAGYSFIQGGEVEQRADSFSGFSGIIVISVFLFILVLLLEFKTFKSILIVLSVIPLGIIGATLALLITGNSFSFVAMIGIIALAGVEVKNTILLVDFTNQLREKGHSLDEAIREAGEVRFLPIILTSLTAIGGLTPIALSSNPLISPLAIVIIGGLISSTLLSRIVTPVVYKLLPPKIGVSV